MGMRKYLRSIAHHNMEKAGIEKINKKIRDDKSKVVESKFSRNWRDFAKAR